MCFSHISGMFCEKKKKKRYDGIKPKTSLNIIYLISFFVFIDVGFFLLRPVTLDPEHY